MPIRRAAATPTQEKAPGAEKDPEAASEESPPADEEQPASSVAPAEEETSGDGETEGNAEKAEQKPLEPKEENEDSKEEMKDGMKYKKSKTKKVKRTIPAWASVTSSKNIPVTNFAGRQNQMENILVEAIGSSNERSGMSFQSVMKYILKKYPGMELNKKKFIIKKAMKKHLEKGTIKQLKGKGLSGTFAMGKQPPPSKKGAQKQESLGDALPLIITRLCEPKEASYYLIKKYLEQHFPSFNIENRPDLLKSALVRAVEKGHLEQITGKGATGTFQLKRAAKEAQLKGSMLEDAITVAITAMNEPKTCSTTSLRKYLVDSNKQVKENLLVANLRRTLTKCKVLGWMEQITGHGFTGTYQLSFPFYPSPTTLYPEKFKDAPKKVVKRKKTVDSSDEEEEEDEEESEEEESEDEAPARRRKSNKRPPPKAQRPPPTKKSRSVSKARGRGRPLAKTPPAKKTVKSGKNPSKKETVSTPKATPVKRGAPSRKSKTPAVKKLSKRGSRKPASRESSPDEPKVEKVTAKSGSRRTKAEESYPEEPKAVKETSKSGSKRAKVEEPTHEEPAAKKQATKGGSKKEASSEKADLQKKTKSSKQSARKSKRGKY